MTQFSKNTAKEPPAQALEAHCSSLSLSGSDNPPPHGSIMSRSWFIFGIALFLSCSEDLKSIERETLEEYESKLAQANSSSSSQEANSSSSEEANTSSSSEEENLSSSSQEQREINYECGSKTYDPSIQYCYENNIEQRCGMREEEFNPNLYECDNNKIYLKDEYEPVDIDGKNYKAVLIGTQTWMAENLNYAIQNSKCGTSSNFLSDVNTEYCDDYGRLYNWSTAITVCPDGWHLPNKEEWDMLSDYVGQNAGTKLKALSGWGSNDTDDYGFSALPGGFGNSGSYVTVGSSGRWWSSTSENEDEEKAYHCTLINSNTSAPRFYEEKNYLLSVRCVKD